jgi:predicted lipase
VRTVPKPKNKRQRAIQRAHQASKEKKGKLIRANKRKVQNRVSQKKTKSFSGPT